MPGLPYDDLLSIGLVKLIEVVDSGTYDPEAGTFKAYASVSIRRALWNSPQANNLTRRQLEKYRQIMSVHDTLMVKLGRKPTSADIADQLGETLERVEKWLQGLAAMTAIGFPQSLSNGEDEPTPLLVHRECPIERAVTMDLEAAIQQLSERDRDVIIGHYWYGLTYGEIAKKLNLQEDNVKQIAKRTREKLGRLLDNSCEGKNYADH